MLHDWQQTKYEPGYKRLTCKRCGAIKECFNMYVKYQDKWKPSMLDGKRQPFCPGVKCRGSIETL